MFDSFELSGVKVIVNFFGGKSGKSNFTLFEFSVWEYVNAELKIGLSVCPVTKISTR